MADDPNNPTPKPQLSDAELRTLAYFAIGVSSEGSLGPKNVAYQLSFAGTIKDGVMTPVGNSGFSIGTLQTDLGQHPKVATELVDAYQAWAAKQTPSLAFSDADKAQITSDLQRDGKAIKADGNRAMDETARANLNKFLASDDGVTFVHNHDKAQVDVLMHPGDGKKDPGGALYQLQQTDLYKNSGLDDQAKLATMVMKLENQAGKGQYPKIINGINDGSLASVDDVKTRIDGLLPNKVVKGVERPDYIESGVDHALKGTEVFNKLRAAQPCNPLHDAFVAVSADPLKSPVDLKNDTKNPDAKHQYDAIKTLFLQNGQSPKLIGALDQDESFGYNLKKANGKVSAQSSSLFGADNDFVVFDGNGHGTAFVGGKWSSVERGDVKRVGGKDQSVDLQVTRDGKTETLLHVPTQAQMQEKKKEAAEPTAPALRGSLDAGASDPRMSVQDRALFDMIRGAAPNRVSDDQAGQLLLNARQAGIRDVSQVNDVLHLDDRLFVRGNTPGFRAALDLNEPVPALRDSLQRVQAIPDVQEQQQRQTLAQTR